MIGLKTVKEAAKTELIKPKRAKSKRRSRQREARRGGACRSQTADCIGRGTAARAAVPESVADADSCDLVTYKQMTVVRASCLSA